ncbi:PREDICTED: insulin-like receptor [Papilio polytes]|uniref:insulin-like receptor n=1 Tax=Papilio polytes TaxID=76194 RepID=UPI0006769F2C|nr:PREDICTED: insulin-like receptor [Papilio polytes]
MRRGRGCEAGWHAWPAAACALLLACARAHALEHLAPGVCPSLDIRNNADQMMKLRGCRVIEGHLSIVVIEHPSSNAYDNMSFPELREVTGYITIYRLMGVRNLGNLFPNLSVVRGMQLFKDYAIVVFDCQDLESLGLRSLTRVERGGVRIQQNDQLCYTNTVDWSRIVADGDDNILIRSNYDTRLCGLCPSPQGHKEDTQKDSQCPTDSSGRPLCWDNQHCQKTCPSSCGGRSCTRNGTCCNVTCLGGCDGPLARDCHVCANYSLGYGENRTCVTSCPANTYRLSRRCVTEQECRAMPPPQPAESNQPPPNIRAYKILNNTCVYMCPNDYMEVGDVHNGTCRPCLPAGCVRECNGGRVDSVAAAEHFRGCTRIKGTLEITLRASGGNTISVLESSLGEIREIDGSLKVVRSYPLVSLMFLKKLRRIGGHNTDAKTPSLYISNNPNLEMLWDWSVHKPIEITRGKLYIHFNSKLCYNHILELRNMTRDPISTFDTIEVSAESNGDQASCFQDVLELKVSTLKQRAALLTWRMYCAMDIRNILGYSIYYIAAEHNVTLYGQRDACSDTWSVKDIPIDNARFTDNKTTPIALNGLRDPCEDMQPFFSPISPLVPFRRYAAYVKTYTTKQDKKGAQSPIIYFKTLPDSPSPPLGLTVELRTPHSVQIKWQPPALPNGTISLYHVEIQANSYNRRTILADNLNYCSNPSALSNMITVRNEEVAEGGEGAGGAAEGEAGGKGAGAGVGAGEVGGTCACAPTPNERFTSRAEQERIDSIDFENFIQNHVYIRNEKVKTQKSGGGKVKRAIEKEINSMLVILSGYNKPKQGLKYYNSTDTEGYVKSLYFELDGSARSLVVEEMRHYTWYTVNLWACRQKQGYEPEDNYDKTWCSGRTFNTFRTLGLPNADVVQDVRVEVITSNKTLPELNVTWKPPDNPNGFAIAYFVQHSRIVDNNQAQDVGLQRCITATDYEANGRGYTLRNMAPGNYSVRVTPVTVSGAGNVSALVYVFIPDRDSEAGFLWAWGVAAGALLLVLLSGGAWYARRALPSHEGNKLFATVNPEYVSTVYVPDEWELPRSSIEFIRELGQGSFGMVYEGIAKSIEKGKPETRCAVKTVNEHATDRERIEFLNEASVMKAFDTYHVVRLLGVVSRGQPTLVVMELMECGDLKTYLRSHRPDADSSLPKKDDGAPPTLQNILQMAIEIADGMAYLSAKKYVHRDLAARNCMVAGDLTVKVGDFGMTRDIYETDYYRKGTKGLLPVRWMSPESLKDGVFSSNSDVWSYGVVLWEMATLAMQPYQGLSNEQVVRYVVEGGVMERPEHCPDRLCCVLCCAEEEVECAEVNVGAVATGSGSNLFGVSGRLATWVRELSSLHSRAEDDAAAQPLQPARAHKGPNGVLHDPLDLDDTTGC